MTAQKPRASCAMTECRRRVRRSAGADGLCDTHYRELRADRESPLELTGPWVKDPRGVRRYVPVVEDVAS